MPLRNNENEVPPKHPSKRRASEGSVPSTEHDQQYWKRQFYALQQQRVTEAEAQLHAFAEESEKRELALKSYIHHLETQVNAGNDLKEKCGETKDMGKEIEGMQAMIKAQRKEIELYQILTGTTISYVDASTQVSCDCTVTNKETKQSTSFRLESTTDDMIEYGPIGKPDASLPEFLHNVIEFEPSQAPVLMQNVLKGIFPEED